MRDVLARDLGARDAVVGYDFSFGRGRAGNARPLRELGAAAGIDVAVIPPVAIGGVPCSSTRIRELVPAGAPSRPPRLLGRPFEIDGAVVRGAGRGRALGFPTANVVPEGELRPKLGHLRGALAASSTARWPARARRRAQRRHEPDVHRRAGHVISVEAYLLDFDGDLYDRRLRARGRRRASATSSASTRSTR